MEYEKHLMKDGRFWPMFWTQFFGAFNDNVFKNALVILITFKAYSLAGLTPEQMVAICGGIFILPFFLFSAIAGQICDKYPKHKLIFYIKVWELVIMCVGAAGFITENVNLLIGTLFFMGLQSAFFGPIKYSILPELINDEELVQGNALVSSGTFVSILLGTILGGALIGMDEMGRTYTAVSVIVFAAIGVFFGRNVQKLKPADGNIKVSYGLFKPTWKIVKVTKKIKSVFLAVLGISWFWFLGAALLSMFPGYGKNVLGGNENVVTLFLAMFSIGVALGSMLCEKFSKERLELGLVPFGTLGMTIFILDLYFIGSPNLGLEDIGIAEFLQYKIHWRVLIDLFGLSVFSGFFIVPLYTFIQHTAPKGERSQVIAGLNIINSLFMVASAVALTLFYSFEFTIPEIFGIWAVLNLLVSIYIYSVIPEFMLRFFAMIVSRLSYRLKVRGHENIPDDKGCILTCNHVSFTDWLLVGAGIKRPVRFIMYYKFMKIPFVGFIFRDARVVPIAGKNEDPAILEAAMKEIDEGLKNGDIFCIFPEGSITHDGKLDGFRPGLEKIIEKTPVPVIPMTLNGLWGSFFSRKHGGKALSKPSVLLTTWFRRVDLDIYPAWDPKDVTAKKLEDYTRERVREG